MALYSRFLSRMSTSYSRAPATILMLLVAVSSALATGETEITYRQFHVESQIVNRYSTTTVTSVVFNGGNVSQELAFQVQLPEAAFISNFTM